MRNLNLLIKPASSGCNMRCGYCFYADVAKNRDVSSYGIMSTETLEAVVVSAFQTSANQFTFAFQGGEPTLVGLEFYKTFLELVKQYNKKKMPVHYAIQTNGYLIDRDWAEFLAKHHFLVGLSLDGNKDTHDNYRYGPDGKGTFSKVMHAAQLLRSAGAEFNILSVVTKDLAKNIGKVYGFYKKNNLSYQQYIPCLDPLGQQRGERAYSLTPEVYGTFLIQLFSLYYHDLKSSNPISIRYFDNLIGMLRGNPPESCGMAGVCGIQNVVEADGSVYPCDFYVLDKLNLGNLKSNCFAEIDRNRTETGFIEVSKQVETACRDCKWYPLCRGGCRRDRDFGQNELGLSYFCTSYQHFFETCYPGLEDLARSFQ